MAGLVVYYLEVIVVMLLTESFPDCPCLHFNERNSSQWGHLEVNASRAVGAKNNCLMIFVGGKDDELVAFQLEQLQLRSG